MNSLVCELSLKEAVIILKRYVRLKKTTKINKLGIQIKLEKD